MDKFVGIVGLPRSGTTVLTALLDAHPDFCLYYEPWNASRKEPPPVPESLCAFEASMESRFGEGIPAGVRVVGFKETTTNDDTIGWTIATLDRMAAEVPTRVVWIYRDLVHCYLSKIEGARKWWGWPDARVSRESFESYLYDAMQRIRDVSALVSRHGGAIVRYEALGNDPGAVLEALMACLGERYLPEQLDYYQEGARPERVMGDPEVARAPRPVSSDMTSRREHESESHGALFDESLALPRFADLAQELRRLESLPAVSVVERQGPRDAPPPDRDG